MSLIVYREIVVVERKIFKPDVKRRVFTRDRNTHLRYFSQYEKSR